MSAELLSWRIPLSRPNEPGTLALNRETKDKSEYAINQINTARRKCAGGDWDGIEKHLLRSYHMFGVERSKILEDYASRNTINCRSAGVVPPGGSLNFHSGQKFLFTDDYCTRLAVERWAEKSQQDFYGEVIYNKEMGKEFANLMYYKSIKAGCSYRVCPTKPFETYALACVFNSAPKLGEPIYIPSEGRWIIGCENDSHCTQYLPFSKCIPLYAKIATNCLCMAGNVTTFPAIATKVGPTLPITEQIREKIVKMHNTYRSQLASGLTPNGRSGTNVPTAWNMFMVVLESSWNRINVTSINQDMVFTEFLLYQKALLGFTQMAWAETRIVGCGAKLCENNYVVVCRYHPRGNIVGNQIFEKGPTCGRCPSSCDDDQYSGLCPNYY